MNDELLLGFGLGVSLTSIAVILALKIIARRQAIPLALLARQPYAPAEETSPDGRNESDFLVRTEETEMADKWRALPGNVIELGATGFQIRLDTQGTRPFHPYKLITPEGRSILDGAEGSLADLRNLGEAMARDRGFFSCEPLVAATTAK